MGDGLLDELVGVVDVPERLLQVDDVDAVALGEDESLHLRVPAAGLVPEVDAAVEQLLHADDCHCSLSDLRAAVAALLGCDAGTGWCAALASGRATHPAVARRDRGGDCPAGSGGKRTREVDPSERAAPAEHTRAGARPVFPSRPGRPQIRRRPSAAPPDATEARAACAPASSSLLVALALVAVAGAGRRRRSRRSAPRRLRRSWTAPLGGALHVTRAFDPPAGPFGAGHRGVDLAGAPGPPVLAAGDGVVVFAGMVAGPAGGQHRPRRTACGRRTSRSTRRWPPGRPWRAAPRSARSPPGTPAAPSRPACTGACGAVSAYLDPLLLLRPPRVRLLPARHELWQMVDTSGLDRSFSSCLRYSDTKGCPVSLLVLLVVVVLRRRRGAALVGRPCRPPGRPGLTRAAGHRAHDPAVATGRRHGRAGRRCRRRLPGRARPRTAARRTALRTVRPGRGARRRAAGRRARRAGAQRRVRGAPGARLRTPSARRRRSSPPAGSSRCVLVLTTAAGSPDDLGRAGRSWSSVQRRDDRRAPARGPAPSTPFRSPSSSSAGWLPRSRPAPRVSAGPAEQRPRRRRRVAALRRRGSRPPPPGC